VKYRQFGKSGDKVSALGFGCMRLPKTDDGAIDEAEATRMLHYAIEHGVTYLDTGYPYHGGESERWLGRALKDGYRQRVKLATKMPCWAVKSADDFDRLLGEQLEKLQTDHLDVYFLHGLGKARWATVSQFHVQDWLDKAMADGRIHAAGFSFHDKLDVFKLIIDAYDHWSMCQIQYNYMNETLQAGTEGLHYAAGKGLAVVVMEPLLGGRLAMPPEPVRAVWEAAASRYSPVEWAMRWLWNKPEVSVVLSGMSTMQQMIDNVVYASRSAVGCMTADDLETVVQARREYEALTPAPCTACGYCMPCPNGVDIPRNLGILNSGVMYDNLADARKRYRSFMRDQNESILADNCIACLDCEEQCPQNIPISEWMPYLHDVLDKGRPYDRATQPPQRRS
jgi:uncharacterized protein